MDVHACNAMHSRSVVLDFDCVPTGITTSSLNIDHDLFWQMVDSILKTNQKGEEIYREYHKTKTLTDVQRKQMVNILVADMIESHG